MDTEELIRKCKAISIKGEQPNKISFMGRKSVRGEQIAACCLVGKIMHQRGVNLEGLRYAMLQIWRTNKEVRIESLGSNIFMFKFDVEADKKRVMGGGPWHFDRALMVLTEPKGIGDIANQSFTHTPFWVHLRNMPITWMHRDMVQELGEYIGSVEDVDTDEEGNCIGEIVRLRISVDITKPLQKILEVETEDEGSIPIPILYERLLDFCFCCGLIGHQYKECIEYKGQPKEDLPYGYWMKATTRARKLKQNRRDKWHREQNQFKKGDGVSDTQSQQKMQNSQRDREIEYGYEYNPLKSSEPLDPMVHGKNGKVDGEHLMQEAGNSRRQLKLLAVEVTEADTAEQSGKLITKEGKEKEREKEAENSSKENNTCQISVEEEVGNGPVANQSKPKRRKWKLQAREISSSSKAKKGLGATKRKGETIALNSPMAATAIHLHCSSPSAKIKLSWENTNPEKQDVTALTKDLSVEAGDQPRREP
ncbi:CCHC-type domain-containing protein [Citrus sinensis]|uniref:CCHC-type domain-containing protein n=1 Tax=Citrus sinensis TaxID=2711 RepID=A0ACB8N331_CITSI|nr:CCHC-type domain-containing protein [Citrus sinensis]